MRQGHILSFLFLPVLLFAGCKQSLSFSDLGPPFALTEKASPDPDTVLVYVYWPHEATGRWERLWLHTCSGGMEEIQRGGYAVLTEKAAPGCLVAEARWDLRYVEAVGSMEVARRNLKVEGGQPYFVRLQQEQGLLTSSVALQPVEMTVAKPEIRRCRRMVPAPDEEIIRRLQEEGPV